MRLKLDPQRCFDFTTPATSMIVSEYEAKYNRVSDLLDEHPELLDLADGDLSSLSRDSGRGRRATYTSEILFRALLVHQLEGTAFRRTMITLAHSAFLQGFLRLGAREAPDFSLLQKAHKAIQPETWQKINAALTQIAVAARAIDPSKLRVDTTVVESTIHWPTDSSLLWDSWRTLYRLFEKCRALLPGCLENRYHELKVKKSHLFITRYSASPSSKRQRLVRRHQRRLVAQVERIAAAAPAVVAIARHAGGEAAFIAETIETFLPRIRRVVAQAQRAWLDGETVPAAERIFSIFEEHVELIQRGRRHKPVEFGHMILLGQSPERFITQYDVMEKKIPDSKLPESILRRHRESFGRPPRALVADKGFCGQPEAMDRLRQEVKVLAIPRRLSDWKEAAFAALHKFRAGIEGSISVLKRAFGLLRCQYRGFRSFVSNVAIGVFCHNLLKLTGPPPT